MGQPVTAPTTVEPGATPAATEPSTTTTAAAKPAEPAVAGDGLGDAGKKALAEERAARKELEKQLQALQPLAGLAAALGVKAAAGQTDVQTLTDQVTAMQQQMKDSELRALRLEVAAEKGLTTAQAGRLVGASRDELAADADQLKTLFPGAPAGTPGAAGTPAPDLSQGARGGSVTDLQAALKAAQEKGDVRESVRLKTAIAEHSKTK